MPTFHRADGDDVRLWAIEQNDSRLRVTFGKVGGRATERVVQLADAAEAGRELRRRARQKRREGYVEQFHVSPLHQALETALVASPDDLAAHMAYADWLSEQAEPRL